MALNHATTLDDDTDATLAPDPLLTDIEALNRRHAFVMNGGKAMVMNFGRDLKRGETLTFSSQADFKARYANRSTLLMTEYGTRLAPLAEQWWIHPKRRAYAGLVFLPGSPLDVELGEEHPHYNLFRGWPVKPVPGDCSLFWAHLKDIICAGDEERYLYVRRWLAHNIQKPEEMPETSLVLRGGQGTGKGTFVNLYGYVGSNPAENKDPTGLFSVDPLGGAIAIAVMNCVGAGVGSATMSIAIDYAKYCYFCYKDPERKECGEPFEPNWCVAKQRAIIACAVGAIVGPGVGMVSSFLVRQWVKEYVELIVPCE